VIEGEFRNGHPRVSLPLRGPSGTLTVEFIVDTGFEGGLALPARLAGRLAGSPAGFTDRALANGMVVKVPVCEVIVEWGDEHRRVDLLVIEGNPLIGTDLLLESLLTVEVTQGGSVTAEPL
jgi:clan AA aspartic protease